MAFRIKLTHSSLNQTPPPKVEEKSAISFFDIPDEKDSFSNNTYSVPQPTAAQVSRPSSSDSKGMAIRPIAYAQADHM
jgi:hypothetical protein